jgi:hypothetical protein
LSYLGLSRPGGGRVSGYLDLAGEPNAEMGDDSLGVRKGSEWSGLGRISGQKLKS